MAAEHYSPPAGKLAKAAAAPPSPGQTIPIVAIPVLKFFTSPLDPTEEALAEAAATTGQGSDDDGADDNGPVLTDDFGADDQAATGDFADSAGGSPSVVGGSSAAQHYKAAGAGR